MNYWIVKGKPSNDWYRYLKPGKKWMWVTRRPSKAWAEGDPVIFWESGGKSRVIGLGEFIRPYCGLTDTGETRFELKCLTKRLLTMPGIEELRLVPELEGASFLRAGDARTVYPLSITEGRHLLFKVWDNNRSVDRVISRLLRASGYPSIRGIRSEGESLASQKFAELFAVGDIIASAAIPRRRAAADLRIIAIEDDLVRFETIRTGHKDIVGFAYLQHLLDGFEELDARRVQPSVNDVLKSVGFSDYTTETYAFTIANAFMERSKNSVFLTEGELFNPSSDAGESLKYFEGNRHPVWIEKIERDRGARQACLAHHGVSCLACGFNFHSAYGPVGAGYIHVHHLNPLSGAGGIHEVDYKQDLVPLCPNCHAVAHLRTPPYSVSEVSEMMAQRSLTSKRHSHSRRRVPPS